jgi:hypothetical protein
VGRVGQEGPESAVALFEGGELRAHLRSGLVERAGQLGDLVAAVGPDPRLVESVRGAPHIAREASDSSHDRAGGHENRSEEQAEEGQGAPDETQRGCGGRSDAPGENDGTATPRPAGAHRDVQPFAPAGRGREATAGVLGSALEGPAELGREGRPGGVDGLERAVVHEGTHGRARRRTGRRADGTGAIRRRWPQRLRFRALRRRPGTRRAGSVSRGRKQLLGSRLAALASEGCGTSEDEITDHLDLVTLQQLAPRPGEAEEERHGREQERDGQTPSKRHGDPGLSSR